MVMALAGNKADLEERRSVPAEVSAELSFLCHIYTVFLTVFLVLLKWLRLLSYENAKFLPCGHFCMAILRLYSVKVMLPTIVPWKQFDPACNLVAHAQYVGLPSQTFTNVSNPCPLLEVAFAL